MNRKKTLSMAYLVNLVRNLIVWTLLPTIL